jgi:hypothetical protein
MRTQPGSGRAFEFGFSTSPLTSLTSHVDASLHVDSVRQLPLGGRVTIEPPAGWRSQPTEFTLQDIKHEQPFVAPVRFHATDDTIGAYTGSIHLESDRHDIKKPFTLLRLGDKAARVQVEPTTVAGQALYLIDNGSSHWHVAPDYHAGVVGWYTDERQVNHLYSAFPQAGGAAMSWLKPWFGGIQPILMPDDVEQEGWPGKLYQEQFTAQICERTNDQGVAWTGVSLGAPLDQEEFRGLRAELEYLTVGGSNLLKVVYRLVNETTIYWRVRLGLLTFCQVDGCYDNSTLQGDGVQRKRTPVMTWAVVGAWGASTNPESGRTMVMVKETPGADLELSDWGEHGGHLFCYHRVLVPPQGQTQTVVYLVLSNSIEEAQRYAALSR